MQRPHGFVILQEVREIWWVTSVQGFEGQGGKFKPYAPFYRNLLELFEEFIIIVNNVLHQLSLLVIATGRSV